MPLHRDFPGDQNRRVKSIQNGAYGKCLHAMILAGFERGLYAEAVLGLTRSEVGDFCRNSQHYDHRVLEDMHAEIATEFRFQRHRWPLLADEREEWEIEEEWLDYCLREFQSLMLQQDFASGFFDALRFQNAERGMAGEERMRAAQHRRYLQREQYQLPQSAEEEDLE